MHEIHLFDHADEIAFEPGQTLFEAGDRGAEMYAIVEGEVELSVGDRVIDTIGAGGILGEMALIDDSPRSGTARAISRVRAATVDRHRFLFLVQEHPSFGLEVMGVMADRLRKAGAT